MLDKGRSDFGRYMSEIFNCSYVWGCKKLKENIYDVNDLCIIANALDIPAEELGKAIKERG